VYCTISRQSDRGNFDPWGVAEKEEKKMKKKKKKRRKKRKKKGDFPMRLVIQSYSSLSVSFG
jgi:hypothetical protein